jgi:hypothetical protein
MAHHRNYLEQLFNCFDGQRRGTERARIKRQCGRGDRHPTLHLGAQPNHTTAAQVGFVGDPDQRERTPAQGVAGIDDGDGLLGR